MLRAKAPKGRGIRRIDLLCRAAAGIACEKGKGIGPQRHGTAAHGKVTVGSRDMTADPKCSAHKISSLRRICALQAQRLLRLNLEAQRYNLPCFSVVRNADEKNG